MMLRYGLGRWGGLVVQRDMGVIGNNLCHLAHSERDGAVIVAGLQVRNHVAADVAGFAVGQDAFKTVAHFDAVLVIGNGQQHHGVTVLLSPALLPIFQWSSSWLA